MKAVQVESHRWCTFTDLTGFTLFRDDEQLPGMITVALNDLERSLEAEIRRYSTQYHTAQKHPDGTRTLNSGPFSTVTHAEVLKAITDVVHT